MVRCTLKRWNVKSEKQRQCGQAKAKERQDYKINEMGKSENSAACGKQKR